MKQPFAYLDVWNTPTCAQLDEQPLYLGQPWVSLSPEDFAQLRSRVDPKAVNDFVFANIVSMTQARLRELND